MCVVPKPEARATASSTRICSGHQAPTHPPPTTRRWARPRVCRCLRRSRACSPDSASLNCTGSPSDCVGGPCGSAGGMGCAGCRGGSPRATLRLEDSSCGGDPLSEPQPHLPVLLRRLANAAGHSAEHAEVAHGEDREEDQDCGGHQNGDVASLRRQVAMDDLRGGEVGGDLPRPRTLRLRK